MWLLALRLVGPPEVHLPLRPLGASHPRVKISLAISGCNPLKEAERGDATSLASAVLRRASPNEVWLYLPVFDFGLKGKGERESSPSPHSRLRLEV